MVTISVSTGTVHLIAGRDHSLLRGVHRAYFEAILNLRINASGDGYEGSTAGRIGELLGSVCDYVDEAGIERQLDANATRLLQRTRSAAQGLAQSIAAGRQVLGQEPIAPIQVQGFRRQLMEHQIRPVRHMVDVRNAANFSVMGSGKTTMVLAAFLELRNRGLIDCLLMIGPGSSFLSWEDEIGQCMPAEMSSSIRLSGSPDERGLRYRQGEERDILLLTYHTCLRDEDSVVRFLRSRRTLLVLDESHYVKGSGAIAEMILRIAPEAERRLILTGTPLPNSLNDLWTPFTFLWPDQHLLGNRIQFRNQVSSPGGENQVKDRVRPLFTRVRKSDLNLPEPRFRLIKVQQGDVQRRVYEALSARTLQELGLQPEDRAIVRQWRRARMIRLLQAATNPSLIADASSEFSLPSEDSLDVPLVGLVQNYARYEVPPKLIAAIELVNRLVAQGEKVLVWTHFIRNIDLMLKYLEQHEPLPLYGDVPREEADDENYSRETHIRRFRNPSDSCRVLIANPGAAAESVSLHRVCHHAVYLDRTFNAGQFMQSRDRIHRVGLQPDETVTYHLLVGEGTIDEVVHARLLAKEARMMAFLDDPNIPVVDFPVSTDQLSGTEDEEALDFRAVVEQLRQAHGRR